MNGNFLYNIPIMFTKRAFTKEIDMGIVYRSSIEIV